MRRSAAVRAEQAAAALAAFLRERAPTPDHPALAEAPETPSASVRAHTEAVSARPNGTPTGLTDPARAAAIGGEPAPLRLPHTDWLHHRLTVTGPAAAIEAFRRAASGAGTIPWHLDLDSLEEDWFHRLVNPAQRTLSLDGARILARQLREAVERRHALAVARVGHSRACPFDLRALVPVPAAILRLGPDHKDALAWLWRQWGTTEALRHVSAAGTGEGGHVEALRVTFWSADWSPWRALLRIRGNWPALRFDLQPSYGGTP